jgi:hypothetical protein
VLAPQVLQPGVAARGRIHLVPFVGQERAGPHAERAVVVDDQDAGDFGHG